MRDGARTMVVQLFIVVRADVAAGEHVFEVLAEGGIDRHEVFELTVDGALLHHHDLAVLLDDPGLDLAQLVVLEDLDWQLAVEDLLANVRDARGAERIRLARPAELRLLLLPALEQRLVRPLGGKRGVRFDRIQLVKNKPSRIGGHGYCFFNVLDRLSQGAVSYTHLTLPT